MGKQFKEFEVPSLQAPNSQVRKKRAWKKQQHRRERYQGLQGAVLPQDTLENRLKAFFNINSDLSEVEKTMCEAIARGKETNPNKGRRASYAWYGYNEHRGFGYSCSQISEYRRWKIATALHLLGVSQKEFDREVKFIEAEAADFEREYSFE